MAGLLNILEKIRVRPGMYLGQTSASNLFIFLEGYMTARSELGIELSQSEIEFYDDFHPWLEKRFGITTSNSWAAMLELQCVNEKAAFDYFFKLFDEFWQRDQSAGIESLPQKDEFKLEALRVSQSL